ncbi:S-adenosylmethionine decarboxylase [Candidatus Enterovibrio altilux]|uniref:S-adenosylmethionine decarboxylase n=1 Tax=Candidatus Enterovibrio altilux TaxID=1927128 RepID=UPI000BBBF565|nr:S-adenosylmethionine decarboxylase [Candidatus Enterovibrio luxaltus]
MDSRGYPFLINIETKSKKLNDDATLKKLFNKILDNSSFTVVGFLDKKFEGGGGGVFLLSESHLSYHTYPENGYISINLYTCGKEPSTSDFKSIKSICIQ